MSDLPKNAKSKQSLSESEQVPNEVDEFQEQRNNNGLQEQPPVQGSEYYVQRRRKTPEAREDIEYQQFMEDSDSDRLVIDEDSEYYDQRRRKKQPEQQQDNNGLPEQPEQEQNNNGQPVPIRIAVRPGVISEFSVPWQVRAEYDTENNHLEVTWQNASRAKNHRLYLIEGGGNRTVLYQGGNRLNLKSANTFELVSFHGNAESMPVVF